MANVKTKNTEVGNRNENGDNLISPELLEELPGTETGRRMPEPSRQENPEELEGLREKIEEIFGEKKEAKPVGGEEQSPPLGDFRGSPVTEEGQIKLSEEQKQEVKKQLDKHKKKFSFSLPSIFVGAKTATEYASKAKNFSTRTGILELEDGKKVFAVYNYPSSFVHRFLDGAFKHFAGDRMSKAKSQDWKDVFESRSNIPTIECNDKDAVLMPYIPNVNAHDLFAKNHEIKNFGECKWADGVSFEDKLALAEQIIKELENVHKKGKTWGETILPNIIITAEKKPVIVDPETQYDQDIPETERKARDLRDILMSICGSLHASESKNFKNYREITDRLISQYKDKGVIVELKKLLSKKPTFIQKIFKALHESPRLGISTKEYDKVAASIIES